MNIPLADLIDALSIVNNKIWHLEEKVRAGEEDKLSLEEIGRRTLLIRNLNRKRVALKNEINRRFDPDNYFEEIKINHGSRTIR